MRSRSRSLALLATLFALACSDSSAAPDGGEPPPPPPPPADASPVDTGAPPPPTDAGVDATPPGPPESLSLEIGPIRAARGDEDTVCVVLDLGNEAPVRVTSIETHLPPGSHHMIVYQVDPQPERPDPTPCVPFSDILGGGRPMFIAQMPDAGLTYPEGTALMLEAHQRIKLEMHYINYFSDAPVDITGSLTLHLAPAGAGDLEPVDMIFWGTTDISVPPRSEGQSVMFRRVPGPVDGQNLKIFGLTSHTHQWGELAVIERAPNAAGAATAELHSSTTWAEPPLTLFDPPLEFDGSDGLRLTCNYFNGSDSTVGFGEGFNQEMCFLWAYYYPSRGFLIAF